MGNCYSDDTTKTPPPPGPPVPKTPTTPATPADPKPPRPSTPRKPRYNTGPSPLNAKIIDPFIKDILRTDEFEKLEEKHFKNAIEFLRLVIDNNHQSREDGVDPDALEMKLVSDCIESFKQSLQYKFINTSSAFRVAIRKLQPASAERQLSDDQRQLFKKANEDLKGLGESCEAYYKQRYGTFDRDLEDEFKDVDEAVEHEYFNKGVSAAGEFLSKLPFVGSFIEPLGTIIGFAYGQVKARHKEKQLALDLLKEVYKTLAITRQLDTIAEILENDQNPDPRISKDFDGVAERLGKLELVICNCLNAATPMDERTASLFQQVANFFDAGEKVPLLNELRTRLSNALTDLEKFLGNLSEQSKLLGIQRLIQVVTHDATKLPLSEQNKLVRSLKKLIERGYRNLNYFKAAVSDDATYTLRGVYVDVECHSDDAQGPSASPKDIVVNATSASDGRTPSVILLSGEQGSGKTWFLKKMCSDQTRVYVRRKLVRGGDDDGQQQHQQHQQGNEENKDTSIISLQDVASAAVHDSSNTMMVSRSDSTIFEIDQTPIPTTSANTSFAGGNNNNNNNKDDDDKMKMKKKTDEPSSSNKQKLPWPTLILYIDLDDPELRSLSSKPGDIGPLLDYAFRGLHLTGDNSVLPNTQNLVPDLKRIIMSSSHPVPIIWLVDGYEKISSGSCPKLEEFRAAFATPAGRSKALDREDRSSYLPALCRPCDIVVSAVRPENVKNRSELREEYNCVLYDLPPWDASQMTMFAAKFFRSVQSNKDLVRQANVIIKDHMTSSEGDDNMDAFRQLVVATINKYYDKNEREEKEHAEAEFASVIEQHFKAQQQQQNYNDDGDDSTTNKSASVLIMPMSKQLAALIKATDVVAEITSSSSSPSQSSDVNSTNNNNNATPRFASLLCQCSIKDLSNDGDGEGNSYASKNRHRGGSSKNKSKNTSPSTNKKKRIDMLDLLEIFIDLSYRDAHERSFEQQKAGHGLVQVGGTNRGTVSPLEILAAGKTALSLVQTKSQTRTFQHSSEPWVNNFECAGLVKRVGQHQNVLFPERPEFVELLAMLALKKDPSNLESLKWEARTEGMWRAVCTAIFSSDEVEDLIASSAMSIEQVEQLQEDTRQTITKKFAGCVKDLVHEMKDIIYSLLKHVKTDRNKKAFALQQKNLPVPGHLTCELPTLAEIMSEWISDMDRWVFTWYTVDTADSQKSNNNNNNNNNNDSNNFVLVPHDSFRDLCAVDLLVDLISLVPSNKAQTKTLESMKKKLVQAFHDESTPYLRADYVLLWLIGSCGRLRSENILNFISNEVAVETPIIDLTTYSWTRRGASAATNRDDDDDDEDQQAAAANPKTSEPDYDDDDSISSLFNLTSSVSKTPPYNLHNLALIDFYEHSTEESRETDAAKRFVDKYLKHNTRNATLTVLGAIRFSRRKSAAVERAMCEKPDEARSCFATGLKKCVDKQSGPLCACLLKYGKGMSAPVETFGQAIQVVGAQQQQQLNNKKLSLDWCQSIDLSKHADWFLEDLVLLCANLRSVTQLKKLCLARLEIDNIGVAAVVSELFAPHRSADIKRYQAYGSNPASPLASKRNQQASLENSVISPAASLSNLDAEAATATPQHKNRRMTRSSLSPASSPDLLASSQNNNESPSDWGLLAPSGSGAAGSTRDPFATLSSPRCKYEEGAFPLPNLVELDLSGNIFGIGGFWVLATALGGRRSKTNNNNNNNNNNKPENDDDDTFFLDPASQLVGLPNPNLKVIMSNMTERIGGQSPIELKKEPPIYKEIREAFRRETALERTFIVPNSQEDRTLVERTRKYRVGGVFTVASSSSSSSPSSCWLQQKFSETQIPNSDLGYYVDALQKIVRRVDLNCDASPRTLADHLRALERVQQQQNASRGNNGSGGRGGRGAGGGCSPSSTSSPKLTAAGDQNLQRQLDRQLRRSLQRHQKSHHRNNNNINDRNNNLSRHACQYQREHPAEPKWYATALLNVFAHAAHMTDLNLAHTHIGGDALEYFFKLNKHRVPSMQTLNLDYCALGAEAVGLFERFVRYIDDPEVPESMFGKDHLRLVVGRTSASSSSSQQQQHQAALPATAVGNTASQENHHHEQQQKDGVALHHAIQLESFAFTRQTTSGTYQSNNGNTANLDDICKRLGGSLLPEGGDDDDVDANNNTTTTTTATTPATKATHPAAPQDPEHHHADPHEDKQQQNNNASQKKSDAAKTTTKQSSSEQQEQQQQQQYGEWEVAVWENWRWYPLAGWSTKLLPTDRSHFSDITGRYSLPKSLFDNLAGRKWVSRWEPVIDPHKTDADGWSYARDFPTTYSRENYFGVCVRRKQWVRRYRDVINKKTTTSASTSNNNNGNSKGSSNDKQQGGIDALVQGKLVSGIQNGNSKNNNKSKTTTAATSSSSSSPAALSSSPSHVKYRECEAVTYECQRFFPVVGWSDSLLPTDRNKWCDITGTKYLPREFFGDRPWIDPEWEVVVVRGDETDEDGWSYARDFPAVYSPEYFFGACVRRRKWRRRYREAELDPDLIKFLSTKPKRSWGLKALHLRNNSLGLSAMPLLHRVLQMSANTLMKLDLGYNNELMDQASSSSDDGGGGGGHSNFRLVDSLAAVLGAMRCLETLYIDGNGISDSRDLIRLMTLTPNSLAYINLSENAAQITTSVEAEPWYEWLRRRRDASAAQPNGSLMLRSLDLSGNVVLGPCRGEMQEIFPDDNVIIFHHKVVPV